MTARGFRHAVMARYPAELTTICLSTPSSTLDTGTREHEDSEQLLPYRLAPRLRRTPSATATTGIGEKTSPSTSLPTRFTFLALLWSTPTSIGNCRGSTMPLVLPTSGAAPTML